MNLDLAKMQREYRRALAIRYDETAEEFGAASYRGSRSLLGKSLVRAAFPLLAEMVVAGHITKEKRDELLYEVLSEVMDETLFDDPIWGEVEKLGWAKGE